MSPPPYAVQPIVMLAVAGRLAATPAKVSGSVASTLISQLTFETSAPGGGMEMMSTTWRSERSVAASLVVTRFNAAPVACVQLPVSSSVIRRSKSASAGDVPYPSYTAVTPVQVRVSEPWTHVVPQVSTPLSVALTESEPERSRSFS